MKIAQGETYGRSGGLGPIADPDPYLVGEDGRFILREARWKDEGDRLAIVDSVIGAVSRPPDAQIVLDESAQAKYVARAEIFADEADRTLRRRDGSVPGGRRRACSWWARARASSGRS